jgi:hypothetical protein
MGSGEVGGGGSVKWTFVHHDDQGNQKDIGHVPGVGNPGLNQVKTGPGVAGGKDRVAGNDSIPFPEIGVRHGNQGHFMVSLRYPTAEAAQTAKATAAVLGTSLVLLVRAVDRTGALNPNVPMEVKVDW